MFHKTKNYVTVLSLALSVGFTVHGVNARALTGCTCDNNNPVRGAHSITAHCCIPKTVFHRCCNNNITDVATYFALGNNEAQRRYHRVFFFYSNTSSSPQYTLYNRLPVGSAVWALSFGWPWAGAQFDDHFRCWRWTNSRTSRFMLYLHSWMKVPWLKASSHSSHMRLSGSADSISKLSRVCRLAGTSHLWLLGWVRQCACAVYNKSNRLMHG